MNVPSDSTWTVIKVRGKRRGVPAEKFRNVARRKPESRQPRSAIRRQSASPVESHVSRSRKRRRHKDKELSRLEQLPAEVLQQIFQHSANIALPHVSKDLALKLSHSHHLRLQMTTVLLRPVLGIVVPGTVEAEELKNATRLLNSRFMAWDFFITWLKSLPEASDLHKHYSLDDGAVDWIRFWSSLNPASGLLPPEKLLKPPFSPEKAMFLEVLTQNTSDIASISPAHAELAQDGLTAAVEQGEARAVTLLCGLGLQSSTELLRIAVADAGCHEEIVQAIICASRDTIDLLDLVIWSWIDRENLKGNEKARWLLEYLKTMQDSNDSRGDA